MKRAILLRIVNGNFALFQVARQRRLCFTSVNGVRPLVDNLQRHVPGTDFSLSGLSLLA